MCLVAALLPAFPLTLLVRGLIEKSFDLGLNETVFAALESGMSVSRQHLDSLQSSFEEAAVEIAGLFPSSIPDSLEAAKRVGAGGCASRIDGMIVSTGPKDGAGIARQAGEGKPAVLSSDPRFAGLTGGRTVSPKRPSGDLPAGLSIYGTGDRGLQLALWSPPGDGFILVYKHTDPDFLMHAGRVLSGSQTFAQLRLSQGRLGKSFFYPFIIIYAFVLALSLCFAFLLAERLASPLRRLEQATAAVASGDWKVRLGKKEGGEIGRLIEGFNDMTGKLEDQRKRLVDMEKMAAWREIARHLAHEIRNPILPIRLTVQEMKDQYPGGDPAYGSFLEESARVVEEELESLQNLVREFSEFARMPGLSVEEGSLAGIAEDVARLYPNVDTDIRAASGMPEVPFDHDRMRMVLVNMFDNAVSACDGEKTSVVIEIYTADGNAVVTFSDNGPGIPPGEKQRIFDPYFTTREEGTGLGLAMVKNIMLTHGGTAEAGDAPGGGAHFVLTLPLRGKEADTGDRGGPQAACRDNEKE